MRDAAALAPPSRRSALFGALSLVVGGKPAGASTPNDSKLPAVVEKVKALETVLTDRQQGKLGPTVKLITNDILRVFKVIMTVPPVADDDYVEFMWMKDADTGVILAGDVYNGKGGPPLQCTGDLVVKGACPQTSSLVASIDRGKRVVPVVSYHRAGCWEAPAVLLDVCEQARGTGKSGTCEF